MIRFIVGFGVLFSIGFGVGQASAQTTISSQGVIKGDEHVGAESPLEITADGSLEWDRNNKIFKAIKNAKALQGDASVSAELLRADYIDGAFGGIDMQVLRAEGNVVIVSKDANAYGDLAIYDLKKSLATMTGKNLHMLSAEHNLFAKDVFEYWVDQGRLIAKGAARLEVLNENGGRDILEADKITALFSDNELGKGVLDMMQADGNVTITTAEEVLTGQQAIYRSAENIAEISGAVKIIRGPNVLEGAKAHIDLNTNISTMLGANGQDGQIRGVFYPESNQ